MSRALVTGAGSERGIGFACARALARAGPVEVLVCNAGMAQIGTESGGSTLREL